MKRPLITALALLGAGLPIVSAASAHAQDNVVEVQPTSDGNLDYGESSCALQRRFGASGSETVLEIRQTIPVALRFIIVSDEFDRTRRAPSITFGPRGSPQTRSITKNGLASM